MNLIRLDQEKLEELKINWTELLKDHPNDIYGAEYQQLFNLIESTGCWDKNLKSCYNKPIFSYVLNNKHEELAIVEIVLSQNAQSIWVKMIDIHMSPKIETEEDNDINTKQRLDVFRAAIKGIFELTRNISGADTVKVYGRTEALISFLRGMHDALKTFSSLGSIKGIEVNIEGRWLVFKTSNHEQK